MATSAQLYSFSLWPLYQQSADIRLMRQMGYTLAQCRRLSKQWRKDPPSEPTIAVQAWWNILELVERGRIHEIKDFETQYLAMEELGPAPTKKPPPKRKPFNLNKHLSRASKLNRSAKELNELRTRARVQYGNGYQTFTQLLSSLNVSKRTLTEFLIGVPPPPVNQYRAAQVQEAYRNGSSITSIRRKFRLSLDETHRYLRRA